MNCCILNEIVKEKNTVKYLYEIQGDWKKYFAIEQEYYIEYDMNIEKIPNSILAIPFIGNIIVMASLFKAQIQVKEMDEDFLNSIPEFMAGYKKMYPELDMDYSHIISYENVVSYNQNTNSERTMLLFSGGVDAYSSLITHEEEKPLLVTICGADVESDNESAWKRVINDNKNVADVHGLRIMAVKSSFRRIMRNDLLDEWSLNAVDDNWWHAFHHSVAMMTMTAPYVYVEQITICYFASSYSINTGGGYTVASDPSIDNYVRFCGCQIVHDGFEFGRYAKIARICEYKRKTNKEIKLRVCYKSRHGDNCGICRKCVFTMMSIILEDGNPKEFGFPFNNDNFGALFASGIQEELKDPSVSYNVALEVLRDIQDKFREKNNIDMVSKELKIFYKDDIEDIINFLHTQCNNCREKDEIIKYLKYDSENKQSWIVELENGKSWLEHQLKYKDERINELLEWIQELENGKEWLEQQLIDKNIENEKM